MARRRSGPAARREIWRWRQRRHWRQDSGPGATVVFIVLWPGRSLPVPSLAPRAVPAAHPRACLCRPSTILRRSVPPVVDGRAKSGHDQEETTIAVLTPMERSRRATGRWLRPAGLRQYQDGWKPSMAISVMGAYSCAAAPPSGGVILVGDVVLVPDGRVVLGPDDDVVLGPDGRVALVPDDDVVLGPDGRVALVPDDDVVLG